MLLIERRQEQFNLYCKLLSNTYINFTNLILSRDSLQHRMSSEGGRRMLMRRILNKDEVIAEPF